MSEALWDKYTVHEQIKCVNMIVKQFKDKDVQ